MSATPWPVEQQINKVRAELTRRGFPWPHRMPDVHLERVLSSCSDWELAAGAIAMWPRPAWVTQLIGPSPYDHQLGELLDARDRAAIASPDESWGHADTGQTG